MNMLKLAKLLILNSILVCGTVSAETEFSDIESNEIDNVKRDPTLVDGSYVINQEDWVHNYKIDIAPLLCSEKKAGFLLFYKGAPSKCESTIKTLVDTCMASKFKDAIPDVIKTTQEAQTAGSMVGQCILYAYLQTKNK